MLQTVLVCIYRRIEVLIVANGSWVALRSASVEDLSSVAEAAERQMRTVTETVSVPARIRKEKDAASLLHVIDATSIFQTVGESSTALSFDHSP